jgi:hypothetical protein
MNYRAHLPNSMGWTWLTLLSFEFLWFAGMEYCHLAAVTVGQVYAPRSLDQLPLNLSQSSAKIGEFS